MIKIIAAVGKRNELGANGRLLWDLPGDMKFFRETTKGATVIMGRKTYESIGRPLPKRRNIVITSNPEYHPDGAETVTSLENALALALEHPENRDIFIIGGGSVYADGIKYAEEILLTEIDNEYPEADVFFPEFDKSGYVRTVAAMGEDGGVRYEFAKYTRKKTEA